MYNPEKDQYFTPQAMIKRMLSGVDFSYIQTILEPSAGSGNIADYLKGIEKRNKSTYCKRTFNIDCIELDKQLQAILKSKGHRVVFDDFLKYETMKEYDLIVANFPFSQGDKHLLKAIQMQKRNGGGLIALVNAETIRNTYCNTRTELQMILEDNNAVIEYITDGFNTSECDRKTDVEVALIKVQFHKPNKQSRIVNELVKAREIREIEEQDDTQLTINDYIRSAIDQYNLECEAGVKLINEYIAMCPYILKDLKDEKKSSDNSILKLSINEYEFKNQLSANVYLQMVRRKYWNALFQNDKFTGDLTSNLKKDYINKVESLKDYDFNLYNIMQIKDEMMQNRVKGIQDQIIELYKELTHEHSYYDTSKNIHLFNGWKTNKAYVLSNRCVLPYMNAWNDLGTTWCKYKPYSYGNNVRSKLTDIDKCLSYLDKDKLQESDVEAKLKEAEETGETKNIQMRYFTVTLYKKGTAHITFTNEKLLKRFNLYGCQHLGFLPDSYAYKPYKDMSKEEKAVIDSFEGEKSYTHVYDNKQEYIIDTNSFLLEMK